MGWQFQSFFIIRLIFFITSTRVLSRFIKQRMLKKNIEKNLHENATEQQKMFTKILHLCRFSLSLSYWSMPTSAYLHLISFTYIYIFYIYRHTAHAWMKSKVKNILRCTVNAIDKPLVVIFYSQPKLIMMMEVVDDVINLHLQSHTKISKRN